MQICPTTRPVRTSTLGLGLAFALALTAGGCATDNSRPQGMSPLARAEATPPQTDAFNKLGYRLEWRGFPTMLPGERIRTLELLGDIVAVQESAGVVSVLEARSGQTRWSDQVAGRLTKFVGILREESEGGRLIVSSESEVYFYDIANGNLKDKQRLAQVVNTKPVRVGDILTYGCANGQLLGHFSLNGFRAWGSVLAGSVETDPVAAGNGRVAICSSAGELVVLDGQAGMSQGRTKMFVGPGAPIGASDTALYVASLDHSLYAFATDGALPIWRKRTDAPLRAKPVYHEGRVYCDMGAAGLTCFDSASGNQIWANPKAKGEIIGIRNKRLLAWDGTTAATLDPAKGTIIDAVTLDNISMLKPDEFIDGHLYAVSPNGIVNKLSPK